MLLHLIDFWFALTKRANCFHVKNNFSQVGNTNNNFQDRHDQDISSPTPKDFVEYILQQVELSGIYSLNDHLRPQWTLCPFCDLHFDVIGHLEDYEEDSAFIFNSMGIKVSHSRLFIASSQTTIFLKIYFMAAICTHF